jgi:hypothetical protein
LRKKLQVLGNYITISVINFRDGQLRPPKTPQTIFIHGQRMKENKGRRRET